MGAGAARTGPDLSEGVELAAIRGVLADQVGDVDMLDLHRRFEDVPFFWTGQYGVALRYVGHAPGWDELRLEGEIGGEFTARFYSGGTLRASASVGRDRAPVEDELLLERRVVEAACAEGPVAGTPAPLGHPS